MGGREEREREKGREGEGEELKKGERWEMGR